MAVFFTRQKPIQVWKLLYLSGIHEYIPDDIVSQMTLFSHCVKWRRFEIRQKLCAEQRDVNDVTGLTVVYCVG